jgi:hypothetical protein
VVEAERRGFLCRLGESDEITVRILNAEFLHSVFHYFGSPSKFNLAAKFFGERIDILCEDVKRSAANGRVKSSLRCFGLKLYRHAVAGSFRPSAAASGRVKAKRVVELESLGHVANEERWD